MRTKYNAETFDITITLTDSEATRLIAVINKETSGLPDPGSDTAGQLEDALKELLS